MLLSTHLKISPNQTSWLTSEIPLLEAIPEFDYFDLEDLVLRYHDEQPYAEDKCDAKISIMGEIATLIILDTIDEGLRSRVYRIPANDAFFLSADAEYKEILENSSTGNDFWDKWNAFMFAAIEYLIVDEILFETE